MRRLRALLSTGRPRSAQAVPPHGVGRRAVLGLIGSAPIALPAALKAASAPAALRGASFLSLGLDAQDMVSVTQALRANVQTLGLDATSFHAVVSGATPLAVVDGARGVVLAPATVAVGPSAPAVAAFIDDVGSGP